MNQITDLSCVKKITLDVSGGLSNKYITAKQWDKESRYLKITILDQGAAMSLPDGTIPRIRITKSDSTTIINDGWVQGNHIYMELTEQILASPGRAKADIGLYKDTSLLSTSAFYILVDEATYDENSVVSSSEYSALTNALAQVTDADTVTKEAKEATTSANTATILANAAADRANAAAETAESSGGKSITDGSVTPEKTSFFYIGKNLFDKSNVLYGKKPNAANINTLTTNTTWDASPTIAIEPGTTYLFKGFTTYGNTFVYQYDSSGVGIGISISLVEIASQPGVYAFTITEESAKYIRLQMPAGKINYGACMLVDTPEIPEEYSEYGIYIEDQYLAKAKEYTDDKATQQQAYTDSKITGVIEYVDTRPAGESGTKTIYVSAFGNNSNSGESMNTPVTTVSKALELGGSRILCESSIYSEDLLLNGISDIEISSYDGVSSVIFPSVTIEDCRNIRLSCISCEMSTSERQFSIINSFGVVLSQCTVTPEFGVHSTGYYFENSSVNCYDCRADQTVTGYDMASGSYGLFDCSVGAYELSGNDNNVGFALQESTKCILARCKASSGMYGYKSDIYTDISMDSCLAYNCRNTGIYVSTEALKATVTNCCARGNTKDYNVTRTMEQLVMYNNINSSGTQAVVITM